MGNEVKAIPIRIYERPTGGFEVCINGHSAAMLMPVPGNTQPSHSATWPTADLAEQGASALLGRPVQVLEVATR